MIRVFNPFKPNGISFAYQLNEFISNLGLLGGIFHVYSNFKRNFGKNIMDNLIRRRVLRRLIWVCTVLSMPHKKDARLIWVNTLHYVQ